MRNYFVTGVSGSGRIEMLRELSEELANRNVSARVFDIGELMGTAAKKIGAPVSDQKFLDMDPCLLNAVFNLALGDVRLSLLTEPVDLNFIGIHATFRWRQRIVCGAAYRSLKDFEVTGFINVVDDISRIKTSNDANPKWRDCTPPDWSETNAWMMEEEYATQILADVLDVPFLVVGRRHRVANLADLFATDKPRIYLSYPITAIRAQDDPTLLKTIEDEVVPELSEHYVVFDPLVIKDLANLKKRLDDKVGLPERIEDLPVPTNVSEITETEATQVKERTIERDFQFIDQSNAVVVIYMTEKTSPGVLSEIIYAHGHDKPVFLVFPHARSPFLERYATGIFDSVDDLLEHLGQNPLPA